jgi:hypothetical protein
MTAVKFVLRLHCLVTLMDVLEGLFYLCEVAILLDVGSLVSNCLIEAFLLGVGVGDELQLNVLL